MNIQSKQLGERPAVDERTKEIRTNTAAVDIKENLKVLTEQIMEEVLENAKAEYDALIEELLQLPPEEILSRAYEKITKEDILELLGEEEFTYEQAVALNAFKQPLQSIYYEWIDREDSRMEEIRETVYDYISFEIKNNPKIQKVMTKKQITEAIQRAIDLKVIDTNKECTALVCDLTFVEKPVFERRIENAEIWAQAVVDGRFRLDIENLVKICEEREKQLDEKEQTNSFDKLLSSAKTRNKPHAKDYSNQSLDDIIKHANESKTGGMKKDQVPNREENIKE